MELSASSDIWPSLTAVGQKHCLYAPEVYFRESMADAHTILGTQLSEYLAKVTFLVFRPDAISGRRIESGLNFLRDFNFIPIHHKTFQWSGMACREAWRFQWNVASLDRVHASTFINGLSDSLMLFLYDQSDSRFPASVRLNSIKGVAPFTSRNGRTLRYEMMAPNRFLTLVHAPDEPVDVVRDVGVFFPRNERVELYHALASGLEHQSPVNLEPIVQDLYCNTKYCNFDADEAWDRVVQSSELSVRQSLLKLKENCAAKQTIAWAALYDTLKLAGADDWDIASIAAQVLSPDVPGQTATIHKDGIKEWEARLNAICAQQPRSADR